MVVYHREIGRETTANPFHVLNGKSVGKPRPESTNSVALGVYHREIGRETTAKIPAGKHSRIVYHREIGRETTALLSIPRRAGSVYHREIGRETTAGTGLQAPPPPPPPQLFGHNNQLFPFFPDATQFLRSKMATTCHFLVLLHCNMFYRAAESIKGFCVNIERHHPWHMRTLSLKPVTAASV